MYSAQILSQIVTQLCVKHKIKHIVLSPGSRNAPLIIGFSLNPYFTCYSIVDERCAAFFALGIAQQINEPVAVVCTSGSALLNYYPAVAEAYYSDIPLVVIAADRPSHLIEIGDGQTIKQENVFKNHINYSANCKAQPNKIDFNINEINKALSIAKIEKGPVHINVPFEEPLYDYVETPTLIPQANFLNPKNNINIEKDIINLVKIWNTSSKKMILTGVMPPQTINNETLSYLANDESVLVLTETTSNLHHPKFIPDIDMLISNLSETENKDLQPDILITFGGMVVSKRIKAYLRKYPPKLHWHIDSKKAYDTYFCLTKHLKTTPQLFLNNLQERVLKVKSNYQNKWLQIRHQKLKKQWEFEKNIPFSDYDAYATVFKCIPKNTLLQLANSTAIRYSQLFSLDSSISVYCNRGTSGIDGSTSTAIGAAVASKNPTLLVTGDLSFFYDSNAIWNQYIPPTFKIVLINNTGGGIFRILPKAKDTPKFETFLETKHNLNASYLCKMFGFNYFRAQDKATLNTTLPHFFSNNNQPHLLEIITPSEENDLVLKDYFKAILTS